MVPSVRGGAVVLLVALAATASAFAGDVIPSPYGPPSPPPALTHASAGRIALAEELGRLSTHYPTLLVDLIENTAGSRPSSPPVTLLLAIAYAETSGDVLDVSEAGAVGLAQATPIAYRQERTDGRLFVTKDYLAGARAYIMKKPLHDADVIATIALEEPNAMAEVRQLLQSALALRREAVEELDLLEPFADAAYFDSIRMADAHNLEVLESLGRFLDNGNRVALRNLRDGARSEYREMLHAQARHWRQYQHDLAYARDHALEAHFKADARAVRRQMPYAAGEYLAKTLDVRFSPYVMAEFLVHHLGRKASEAERLDARSPERVEQLTAALYNGGTHNVKRMLCGLISYLPETENYMRKVPAMRRRLDDAVSAQAKADRRTTVAPAM
jgi:hypothetical protein